MLRTYLLCLVIGIVSASPAFERNKLESLKELLKKTRDRLVEEKDIQKRGWCSYELGFENRCSSAAPWCYTGLDSNGITVTTCSPKADPCGGDACQPDETCIKTGEDGFDYNLGFQCMKAQEVIGAPQPDDVLCELCMLSGRTCVRLPGNDIGCFNE